MLLTPSDDHRSARFRLRHATAGAHERLDALCSAFDLRRRADYGVFLSALAAAYVPVETALVKSGAGRLVPGWADRLRGGALIEDLARLGLTPPRPATAPRFRNAAEMLGGLYVLEGSRLGGAVLIRSVPPGLPTAFLTPGNPADWRALISVVDLRLSSDALLADAVSAAEAIFALFEQSVQTQLESRQVEA